MKYLSGFRSAFLFGLISIFTTPFLASAYDLNKKLSVEGTLTGVYQYGDFNIEGVKDTGRGAVVLDLGINFHPTDKDEFQVTLSNAFANDEVAQFMNDILVNNTLANLPSYDIGGVAELDVSNFSLRGLAMSTKNEELKEYKYCALQLGYKLDTPIGEGNYRIYGFTTNKKFQNRDGTGEENLQGFGISADQKLSEIIGAFARLGWQDDKAVVDDDQLYSGGLNISGNLWGRKNDVKGITQDKE